MGRCLRASDLPARSVEVVAVSSCCDLVDVPCEEDLALRAFFPRARILHVPHHLSHALYAHYASGYGKSLVVVNDAGGNTLTPGGEAWWALAREQTTYFVLDQAGARVVGRDFERPYEAGFGEIFRAVTKFLGWRSGYDATKTMALSALGQADGLDVEPPFRFDPHSGRIRGSIANDPMDPIGMIRRYVSAGSVRVEPRRPGAEFHRAHADLAARVQRSFEDALLQKLRQLHLDTGISHVCLGGGVAYNCKANQRVAQDFGSDRVFVPASPGDTGQAIGNAIAASVQLGMTVDRQRVADPYLGPTTRSPKSNGWGGPPTYLVAAELVASGLVVGHVEGPSEFGARALGNRSILAPATDRRVVSRLNQAKQRESFMPFAGSVQVERAPRLFEGVKTSPYMQFTMDALGPACRRYPAVVHVDGTARMHLVHRTVAPWMWWFLEAYRALTNEDVVLNTSLNGPGEPIVESATDAERLFQTGVVDALLTEEGVIRSRCSSCVVGGMP